MPPHSSEVTQFGYDMSGLGLLLFAVEPSVVVACTAAGASMATSFAAVGPLAEVPFARASPVVVPWVTEPLAGHQRLMEQLSPHHLGHMLHHLWSTTEGQVHHIHLYHQRDEVIGPTVNKEGLRVKMDTYYLVVLIE